MLYSHSFQPPQFKYTVDINLLSDSCEHSFDTKLHKLFGFCLSHVYKTEAISGLYQILQFLLSLSDVIHEESQPEIRFVSCEFWGIYGGDHEEKDHSLRCDQMWSLP
jgi:hypothetical protein